MVNSGKLTLSLFLILWMSMNVFAQSNTAVADSLDKQFERMINSSNNFQDYKVVKIYKLSDIRKATKEEINKLSADIEDLNQRNEAQARELAQIEKELTQTQSNFEKAEKSKDEFTWLGMQIQKDAYQGIVYGIIFLLILVLAILIFTYRRNKKETQEAKKLLEETNVEFDAYRQKALETQQKLGRQLQDERMKNTKSDLD